MGELWKDIPGYEGFYQASTLGRVKSVERVIIRSNGCAQTVRERVLRPGTLDTGHLHLVLYAPDKSRKTLRVHQCVMWAFVGPTPTGLEICHNNGDCKDNRLSNLRFDTHANNMADTVKHGVSAARMTTECPSRHAYTSGNTGLYLRRDGVNAKYCRQCKRDRWRAWESAREAKGELCRTQ